MKKLAAIIETLQRDRGSFPGSRTSVLPDRAADRLRGLRLVERLHAQGGWEIVRLRDYIREGKDDYYRALHLRQDISEQPGEGAAS